MFQFTPLIFRNGESASQSSQATTLSSSTPHQVSKPTWRQFGVCARPLRFVLVPTGTTRDDLDSVLPWMKELLEAKVRASFVLNKVNRRTNSFAKARSRLIRIGPVCPIDIPALEEIHSQSDNGLTVLDMVKSKGHEPMEGLWMFTQQETAYA